MAQSNLTQHYRTVHILHCTVHILHCFSNFFCFSRQRADFWCAALNLDFVNILILYFLTQCTFCTAQCTFCTIFTTFLFFKLESCNLVCRREFGFRKHSYTVFFTNQGACSAYFALHSAHFAPFFQLFCFSSKRAVIWRASVNLNFVNILILYFLAIRVCTVHILHCFPNFFVFQAREL